MTANTDSDDGPYVAWYQGAFGREVVEIVSQPYWVVPLPYIDNWRRPTWRVDIVDPTPRSYACSGQMVADVRGLHPMNAQTRDLLRLREGRPPSPHNTPRLT